MIKQVIQIIWHTFLFSALVVSSTWAADLNLARHAVVSASSKRGGNVAQKVVDGLGSDTSRWLTDLNAADAWIELSFPEPLGKIRAIDIYTGWKLGYVLDDFDLTVETGGKWFKPPAGKVRGNIETMIRIQVDVQNVSKIRIAFLNPGLKTIREIAIYANGDTPIQTGTKVEDKDPKIDRTMHQIGLNQVGYLPSQPKRFTAPLSQDGTRFELRAQGRSKTLYAGVIKGHIGNFTAFQPKSRATHYVIEVSGGTLKPNTSDPFLITESLYEDQYRQPAVDFLIDARSVVGTHPSAYGGCPRRDGTYYDAIVPSLVLFYLANPALVESMPRQMDWQADKKQVLLFEFEFDAKNKSSEGVMYAVRNYFRLAPPQADAPDVVKLIHWGAGYYLVNPATKDPSRDPIGRDIHPQTVEQVSYVLWVWPLLKQWLSHSFYERCYDFCFDNWERSLAVSEHWDPKTYITVEQWQAQGRDAVRHPYKGRHAPGHSIVPNLLMHEVAKRAGRSDADIYLQAAVTQAEWIINNLDWNDPRTTKGHRMSEHRTIPNLVWLLQKYPDHAPEGLQEKITAWARVAVSRSHNLWDFRRYDMKTHWTLPEMNDLGNSLSLPAIAMAVRWVIDDPQLKARLRELAFASIDHVFGRNPRPAAAPSHPQHGFPEIERGWPRIFPENRCARLERCRGSLSSLPGGEMYLFNPEALYRHEEGCVNYGASWCISLAYMKWDKGTQTTPILPHLQQDKARPNIVWIMLEDWSPDMSCYGAKGIHTPHTDKLAAQGIRYTRAFCTSPVCSTSRSAMMTGFHQNYIGAEQHRLAKDEKRPLPYGIKPLPLLLKEAGYYTALMKSKKTDCNFQADLGFTGKDWKDRQPDQPFFAQITLTGTHRKWQRDTIQPIAPEDIELPPYYADTPLCRRDWANGLEQMQICDREIGDILQRLETEGLAESTLVFLIGDNGRCHIRGKQFVYDPGLQIPLIVRWPGKIKPGQVKDDLVQTIDITATILEAAGITPPHPLHGQNLFSDTVKNRQYIFAARDRMGSTHDAMRVIRSKRYKLIHNLMPERAWLQYSGYKEDNYPMLAEMNVLNMQGKLNEDQAKFFAPSKPEFEFFDIQKDPHELNNLAEDPALAAVMQEMLRELNRWRVSIKDQGVSPEFRAGSTPATYPTRSLAEWQECLEVWKPWVFRKPGEKVRHPFAKQ